MKKLILLFLLINCACQAQRKMVWPGHKKAVIILTYDDALNSQLNNAIPQLESAGLVGTFFLTANVNSGTIPKWRAVSAKGNELANHTLYHPCLMTTVKGSPINNSGNYTVYQMLREIGTMNSLLNAVDGKATHTYAYPCTELSVGGVNYVDSLRKSGIVKYARIGGDENAVVTDFINLDPLQVPAWGLHPGTTGEQLIAFVKKVQQSGGMGVFMFHGIGGDYLTTPAASHRELLQYLQKNKNDIWVATFQQAMDYIAQVNKDAK
jgi:peptidoglycan/xylan/chitin deacetylase (PgdA/CDA1 family)